MMLLGWLLAWIFFVLYLWALNDLRHLKREVIADLRRQADEQIERQIRQAAVHDLAVLQRVLGEARHETIH